jgi:hypothetical protein
MKLYKSRSSSQPLSSAARAPLDRTAPEPYNPTTGYRLVSIPSYALVNCDSFTELCMINVHHYVARIFVANPAELPQKFNFCFSALARFQFALHSDGTALPPYAVEILAEPGHLPLGHSDLCGRKRVSQSLAAFRGRETHQHVISDATVVLLIADEHITPRISHRRHANEKRLPDEVRCLPMSRLLHRVQFGHLHKRDLADYRDKPGL